MFKKNLMIGILPALLVLFVLTGCSSPTDGSPGGIGLAQLSGTISAEQLAESFAVHDVIQLDSSGAPSSVEGLVPAGKVLVIAGPAQITAGETLTVNGSVEIKPTASFDTTTGILAKESAGTIFTRGELVLAAQYYEYPIIVSRTSFDSAGVLSLPGANATAINEFFAKPGINNIKNDTITLRPAQVNTLTNWTGAKKLILAHGTSLALDGFDVSAETLGQLVLDSGVIVTIPQGSAVKANPDTANITVLEGASIILPAATADHFDLQGKIIVDGGVLIAADGVTTGVIPATVDLSKGWLTVASTTGSGTITLPNASITIGGIDVADTMVIDGPATTAIISVGTITGTAGEALTLPGVAVVVDEIELPTGTLTIGGSGTPPAVLSPAKISGAAADILTFSGTNVVLAGPIDLSATITAGLANLGTAAPDQLVQLAKITGGTVNLPAITFNGTDQASSIFSTIIAVDSDDITISADTTFREGFRITTSGKIANTVAGVTLTLGSDSSSIGGLDVSSGGGLTVTGSGNLALTGNLVVAGPTTFNGGAVTLAGSANTINAKLTVGSGTTVTTTGGLIFTAGTYTGTGVTVNAGASSTITATTTATDQLILGDNAVTEKLLTLAATGAGTGVFTVGSTATVTLSGISNGAIVVTPTGASLNATFTIGATAELKLGDGIIALDYASSTNIGSLVFDSTTAKLSGFTFNGGNLQTNTAAYQPSFTTNPGESVLDKYYTDGVTIDEGTGTYVYDAITTFVGTITGNSTSYAARGPHGGIIRKTSDVAVE